MSDRHVGPTTNPITGIAIAPITTKRVKIVPALDGRPDPGFVVDKTIVIPETLEIEGPANHLASLETIPSTPIELAGKRSTFRQTADLDISDPVIRVVNPGEITVEVVIRSTP